MDAIDPATHYEDGYFGEKERLFLNRDGLPEAYYGPARAWEGYEHVLDALLPLLNPRPASVLDLGCASGDFVRRCWGRGIPSRGIDISKDAIEHPVSAELAGFLQQGTVAEAASLCPDGADLVTALDLLEHIYHDEVPASLEAIGKTTKRYFFACVCTAVPALNEVWIAKKGAPVPPEREWQAISGHVTCLPWNWWVDALSRYAGLEPMWEQMCRLQVAFNEHVEMRKAEAWGPRFIYLGKKRE
jgi:SAM-dependent methyltransferase